MASVESNPDHRDSTLSRTYEGLRLGLVSYHNLRQGEHLSQPETSLGVQRVPQHEGGFENSSSLLCDVELSLRCKSITFENASLTFAYLTHGGTYRARDLIAKKWPPHSAGAIARIASDCLDAMVRHCAGRCHC